MTDIMSPEDRSRLMSRVTGKDTGPELKLRKSLWHMGLRYRLHYNLPGRPDLAFLGPKVAVFVDGCFWHGCPEHGSLPDHNEEFWRQKLKRNVNRDQEVTQELESLDWKVIRIWEHQIEDNLEAVAKSVAECVERRQMERV